MKRYNTLLLGIFLVVSSSVFGQKDMQPTPELRKFVQQGWKIQHAHISFDSLSMYLSALAPGKTNYDLYISRSRAGIWNTPEPLSDEINSASDELWPSISSDERRLYFIRRTTDQKLYKSSHGAQGQKTSSCAVFCPWLLVFSCECYLACSSCRVLVGWSHTSVGPKYWMGPG